MLKMPINILVSLLITQYAYYRKKSLDFKKITENNWISASCLGSSVFFWLVDDGLNAKKM